MGSNPVQAWIFNCLSCVYNCDDQHNVISFSAVEIYDLSYIHLLKFIMLHFIVCLRLFPSSLPEERVSEVSHPTASRITFLHAISIPWLLDDSMVLIQSQSCLPSPYAFGYTFHLPENCRDPGYGKGRNNVSANRPNPLRASSRTTLGSSFFFYRETPPRGSTPYLWVYHFDRKATPFVYLFLNKISLSHTYFITLHPFLNAWIKIRIKHFY